VASAHDCSSGLHYFAGFDGFLDAPAVRFCTRRCFADSIQTNCISPSRFGEKGQTARSVKTSCSRPTASFRLDGIISCSAGKTPRMRLDPTGQIRTDGVPFVTETRAWRGKHVPTRAGFVLQPSAGSICVTSKDKAGDTRQSRNKVKVALTKPMGNNTH
jgi:hypothetical protein